MTDGYGNFLEWYAIAPYQFPLNDMYPVVRIPVAGPEPFNTLVVVRCQVFVVPEMRISDGRIDRSTFTVATPFKLIGHDPRITPAVQHSTTVSLQMIQASDDSTFVIAVDTVSGEFDGDGTWTVTVDVASEWDQVLATAAAYSSSWILCHEPPIDHARTRGTPAQQGIVRRQVLARTGAFVEPQNDQRPPDRVQPDCEHLHPDL